MVLHLLTDQEDLWLLDYCALSTSDIHVRCSWTFYVKLCVYRRFFFQRICFDWLYLYNSSLIWKVYNYINQQILTLYNIESSQQLNYYFSRVYVVLLGTVCAFYRVKKIIKVQNICFARIIETVIFYSHIRPISRSFWWPSIVSRRFWLTFTVLSGSKRACDCKFTVSFQHLF